MTQAVLDGLEGRSVFTKGKRQLQVQAAIEGFELFNCFYMLSAWKIVSLWAIPNRYSPRYPGGCLNLANSYRMQGI
jgi:hypothetical protein